MLAVFFSAVFPSLYRWLLPRVSPLDAAAYARPIIELEVAMQIDSERETHGRGTFHRAFYDPQRVGRRSPGPTERFQARPTQALGQTPRLRPLLIRGTGVRGQSLQGDAALSPLLGERQSLS